MNNLQPATFILPVIALLLVIFLYLFLLKKVSDKTAFKRLTFISAFAGFLLNFAWEMLQMPLYKGMELNMQSAIFCALASVADAVMVLLIYYAFALIYKDPFWLKNLTLQRILILASVGGAGAIAAERRYVSLGNWTYSESMPVIPVVNVALSPVLQFMILPAIIYSLCFYFLNRRYQQ